MWQAVVLHCTAFRSSAPSVVLFSMLCLEVQASVLNNELVWDALRAAAQVARGLVTVNPFALIQVGGRLMRGGDAGAGDYEHVYRLCGAFEGV
jgi:hypothetical protein